MIKWKNSLLRFLTIALFLFCFVPYVFGATVDVLIVYDTKAKSWVSTHGGMTAFAEDAVAKMNQATANSNVNLTFRLVHAADVSYTHSDLYQDLLDLQAGTGNLSIVHEWRDTYGADIVAMFADTGSASGIVGYGYALTSSLGQPDWAFSTNAIQSVNISHTLTHEAGHNLGCDHSKSQVSNPPMLYLNSYSAGWYFTGTNSVNYHTIMAYSEGVYTTEAPLFSTPLLNYKGTPAGDSVDGDNARNIRETMDILAAYRPTQALTLNAPTLSSPANGSTGQTANVSVTWLDTNSSPQETGYKLRIKPSGGSYTEFSTGQNVTSYTTSGLIVGVTYYWSVKAVGNGTSTLDSAYPTDRSFTVILLTDNLLYGSFPGAGIWKWDGTTWTQATPNNPQLMAASGSILYGAFGVGAGIWKWDGTTWTQATPNNPQLMVASGSILYGAFTGAGIWKWDGTTWTQATPSNPQLIAVSDSILYGAFGAGAGIWKWDGTTWTQATPSNPQLMAASDSILYGAFTGYGIWKWDGVSWSQITTNDPQGMAASGTNLYGDYGTAGIWKWDGTTWSQITTNDPALMEVNF